MYNPTKQGPLIFIPENFDAKVIINKETYRTDKKVNITDAMHFILHTIIQQERKQDARQHFEETGYFSLNAKILKENCGKYYAPAAKLLKENGVISINSSYQVGKKNKGYCIIGDYASADLRVVALSKNGIIKRNYLAKFNEKDKLNNIELDKIPFITQWFDKDLLKVDLKMAHNFVEFYRNELTKHNHTEKNSIKKHKIENHINNRYNNAIKSIRRIDRGDFELYRLGKDNRLHSSISSLMKEFRSFLLYNGEHLIGIDLKSSQPYLFTQLLRQEINDPGHPLSIKSIYPELYKTMKDHEDDTPPPIPIIMLITYGSKNNPHKQINFLNIDWTKDFYEEVIEMESNLGIPIEKRVFKNRSGVKHSIMLDFYLKSNKKKSFEFWKRFETLFPLEASIINYFNELSWKDKKNYLPILLQRLESKLMLDIVCKEISEQLPDAPLIPIHDAILTTPNYVEQVKDIIKNTLLRETGIEPGLKLDYVSPADIEKELINIAKSDFDLINENLSTDKENFTIKVMKPLMYGMPTRYQEQILSTRYLDSTENNDWDVNYET